MGRIVGFASPRSKPVLDNMRGGVDHDESLWVVGGEITFGIDGQAHRLGPGDRLMLPAGTIHTAHAGPHGARYLIGQRHT